MSESAAGRTRRVSAVVLAAGGSSRLGRPKQLLPLGGRPLLQHTLDHVTASLASEVVVVLGAHADAVSAQITPGRARVVLNADWTDGQSTSVRAGLAALPPNLDAALFVLGDQPLIGTDAIDAVIAAYQVADPAVRIVLPVYGGEPGQPVLFDRALWPEVMAVQGDRGAREVVRAHPAATLRLPIGGDSRPDDVDDEAAYERVAAAWAARTARVNQ